MSRISHWSLLVLSTTLLASCGPNKEEEATAGLAQRQANAGYFRVVNLSGNDLSGTLNGQQNGPLVQSRGTSWLKRGGGTQVKVDVEAPPLKGLQFADKLPNKAIRTYYAVAVGNELKSFTIDNDPKEPAASSPMIRGVNLTNDKVQFSVSVEGQNTDLGEAGSQAGTEKSTEIPNGKLIATATVNGMKLTTEPFDGTSDHAFSVVVYKNGAGKTKIALVVNHEKSGMAGSGSSAMG